MERSKKSEFHAHQGIIRELIILSFSTPPKSYEDTTLSSNSKAQKTPFQRIQACRVRAEYAVEVSWLLQYES